LGRGNLQWPGILELFSKSYHFDPIVFVDLLMNYAARLFDVAGGTDDDLIDQDSKDD